MSFGVIGIQKCKRISADNFFLRYGFMNCIEILDFVFSNIITRGVSTCEILTFLDQYFHKYKGQNIVKFSFLAFLVYSFNFALKIYGTLKMFLLSAQNNFYIILSSYVEGHVQKDSSLNFMSSVGFQASKMWMIFWKIYCKASLEIIFRQK